MRRRLTVTGLLIVLAVGACAAALDYLAFTRSGLVFITEHVPQRFGGVRLRIEGVSGTLASGMRARQIVIDQRRVHLTLDDVYTRLRFAPLLWRTLVSPDTTVGRAHIEVKRSNHTPTGKPQFLPWWLVIRVEHGHVGDLVLKLPKGAVLTGTDIDGTARLSHRDIRFSRVRLRVGTTAYDLAGALHAARPLQLSALARISWRPPREPPWIGEASMRGDLGSLTVTARTLSPFHAELHGLLHERRGRWSGHSELALEDLDLRAWHRTDVLGRISARLVLTGEQGNFKLTGTVEPTGLHAGPLQVELEGGYTGGALRARRISIIHRGSGTQVTAAGGVRIAERQLVLDLQGNWRNLRWPLAGRSNFQSASGRFTLAGRPPYRVSVQGLARIGSLAQVPVQLEGTLGSVGLTVTESRLRVLGGQIRAQGELTWLGRKRWSVKVHAADIDPAKLRPILPGRLSFALSASGAGFGAAGAFDIRLDRLTGRLRGQPAGGSGAVSRSSGTWNFQHVRLSLGGTRIALDGRLDHQATLRFAVAGDLRLLSSEDLGHIEATGTVRGPLDAPDVRATLWGSGIRIGEATLAAVNAAVDFDPTSRRPSAVSLHLRRLKFRRRLLRRFDFTLSGPASNLEARLDVLGPGLSLRSRVMGSFQSGVFAGELTALSVIGAQSLDLHLHAPAPLILSAARTELGRLCLVGTPAGLCAQANWTPASWSAALTASALPLATLTAGLTPAVEYQGTIGAEVRLAGGRGVPAEGAFRATLAHAVLSRRLVSGKVERTAIGSGLLTLTATPSAVDARASLTSGAIGTLGAVLDVKRGASNWRDMPLSGHLHAQTSKLDLISLYLPGVDEISGRLMAEAGLAGTLGRPRLTGLIEVSNGAADLYRPNLRLRQLALTATLSDAGLAFNGSARVGEGTLQADGRMSWHDALPYGWLRLRGKDVRVVDIPEARIDATPDLNFQVADHRIDVTGQVQVTHAKITPKNITGAVGTSSDQVIVGRQSPNPAHRYQVTSTISLELGHDVNVDTMGLTGKLTGKITVRSGYGAGTRATGELYVEQGQYSAYARTLYIQTGRLFFRGGPLDNPGIEIRAVRRYPDVTAGINVSGTLKQPQVSFFSDPSLSQAQIMSLILSGGGGSLQALSTSASTQSRQNTAANELLAQGGAILAQQLGTRLGLPNVSLQTDLNNETSLVLGKYLSPRLYVSYGVGLTEQLSAIRLRYSIGKHWTIRVEAGQGKAAGQAKSGQIGGADLVFSVTK